jgi:hypothetical protein
MRWPEWLILADKITTAWKGQQLLANGSAGRLYWSAGVDPGTATGFSTALYLVPPAAREVEDFADYMNAGRGQKISVLGQVVDQWGKILKTVGMPAEYVPKDLLGTYDATGAVVLAYWAEYFASEENSMVRQMVSRIRGLLSIEHLDLGPAGVNVESFRLLRMDKDRAYLSPVRVTAALEYALEDEFEIATKSNTPGDAKNAFSELQFKHLGIWASGPDHVRDALSHNLFGIRKSSS